MTRGGIFDEYAAALGSYTPEWAQEITDIPAETIRRIARELATTEGAAIEQGFRGGLGIAYLDHAPGVYDENSLSTWSQETAITVRKAS